MNHLLSCRWVSVQILTSITWLGIAFGLPAALAIESPGIQEELKQSVRSQPLNGTAALLSPAPKAAVVAGVITGRVILTGKPPKERVIDLDPSCRQLKNAPATTRFFVTSQDGGLADVFVVLTEGLPLRAWPGAENPAILHISGCFYEPYVSAARAGQEIRIDQMGRQRGRSLVWFDSHRLIQLLLPRLECVRFNHLEGCGSIFHTVGSSFRLPALEKPKKWQ
jgi:hypothetical protein